MIVRIKLKIISDLHLVTQQKKTMPASFFDVFSAAGVRDIFRHFIRIRACVRTRVALGPHWCNLWAEAFVLMYEREAASSHNAYAKRVEASNHYTYTDKEDDVLSICRQGLQAHLLRATWLEYHPNIQTGPLRTVRHLSFLVSIRPREWKRVETINNIQCLVCCHKKWYYSNGFDGSFINCCIFEKKYASHFNAAYCAECQSAEEASDGARRILNSIQQLQNRAHYIEKRLGSIATSLPPTENQPIFATAADELCELASAAKKLFTNLQYFANGMKYDYEMPSSTEQFVRRPPTEFRASSASEDNTCMDLDMWTS
jgi:hypothetical protein